MEVFYLTLKQMLSMFTMITAGYIVRKKCKFPPNADNAIAKIETYVFVPALFLYVQMTQCTVESFREDYRLMLYGLAIVLFAIAIAFPLSKLFVPRKTGSAGEDYQRNIYRYALTFGNYGYLGTFVVLGIWGDTMLYKYMLFTALIGIICNSWGLYILVPKEQGASVWKNLRKGLTEPPIVALVLGIILGLTGAQKYIPEFFITAIDSAGDCQGPVAMVLAGFIIGGYDFKKLLTNTKVYIVTFLRLIVIPSVMMLILKLVGAPEDVLKLTLMAFAVPLGMNTIVYPATYGGDTETGASMTTISHTLSVITLPIMYLVFIVLM